MKAFIILVLMTVILYSCTNKAKESDASGTYVTNFKNEYTVTEDTLIISKAGSSDLNYSIERKSGYQKIREGALKDKEHKVAKWDATYDPASNVLKQTDLGMQVYVIPLNHSVKLGASEYKKVK